MQYQLIRSNRKTIAISFDRDGNLCVKAPYPVSRRVIENFLKEKEDWIFKTKAAIENQRIKEITQRKKLENGDILYYLGQQKILTVIREDRQRSCIKCVKERLILTVPYDADYDDKKLQLEKWYRKEAALVLQQKVQKFANLLGVNYQDIRIKDQKSRWGSCSSKGNLNFNFRIIMAPEQICDYVVIHELCHLVHMNHSDDFWMLVKSICPTYKQCIKWLKDNGRVLYF